MHICNRYQTTLDLDRMNMQANQAKCNQLFANFDQRVRPVTKRIRSMLLSKQFKLEPSPTPEQIEKDMSEFNERILPMFNHQLVNKLYFCGEVITGYDLQVFCEINSIKIIAEKTGHSVTLDDQPEVTKWMQRINFISEVQDKEEEFQMKVGLLLQNGL